MQGDAWGAPVEELGALARMLLLQLLAQRGKTRHVHEANGSVKVLLLGLLWWLRVAGIRITDDNLRWGVASEEA